MLRWPGSVWRLVGAHFFTLYDELTLTPSGESADRFGLHANCSESEEDIATVLISFEEYWHPLAGWTIDHKTMVFEQVEDPTTVGIGMCLSPEPRSSN